MRIGVDGTAWLNPRGFGRFTRNAIPRLIEAGVENEYVIYCDASASALLPVGPNVSARIVPTRQSAGRAVTGDGQRGIREVLRLTLAVKPNAVELFLFPSVFSYFPVWVPSVVGLHDTIADTMPDLTLPDLRSRLAWRAKEGLALRRARRIFTVSEASRVAISERFRLDPARISVVSEAPDSVFRTRPRQEVAGELRTLGLSPQNYIFYAGGISPHKDLGTLVEAYAAVRRSRGETPPLVLAGSLSGDPYFSAADEVKSRIAKHGLNEHVLMPGFVSDEALACLYTGALLVVNPSLAEGFGLPAVEAAACGAPVLLSDLPAHQESLSGAARFFPPGDIHALTGAIGQLLDDPAARADLSRRCHSAVARLSWERSGAELRAVVSAAAR